MNLHNRPTEATQYQTDEGGGPSEEVDHPSGPTSASPPRTMTGHDGLGHSGSEHSPSSQTHLQAGTFLGDMGGRGGAHYPGAAAAAGAATHMLPLPPNDQFIDDMGFKISSTFFPVNNQQRRSSMYTPPGDYANPPSAGLYNQSWSMGSAAPSAAATYSFQQQQQQQQQPPPPPAPTHGHFAQAAVPMGQGQYMHAGYDASLQRGALDQGSLYRSTAPTAQGAYPGYMQTSDGRTVQNPPIKTDGMSRGPVD